MADHDSPPTEFTTELIASLASEGRFVDARSFSLDPHKAREKLRSYQLDDPHAYVLLLVEAACIAGDSSIDFSCAQTTQANFTGLSLTHSQLENVFDSVFSNPEGSAERSPQVARLQRLLGLAANAALALAPRSIEIENVDADGQLNRLTILPGGEIRCEHDGGGPQAWTRFVVNGEREDHRDDREVELLQQRCRYTAQIVVSIYGRRISEGSRPAMLGVRTKRIKLGSRTIGRAGLIDTDSAELWLHTRGVLSETIQLEHAAPGFLAIVDTDLRKDLSQSAVIRGPVFDQVIAALEQTHAALTRTPRRPLFG